MAQYKTYGDKAIPGDVTFTNCSDGDGNQVSVSVDRHLTSIEQSTRCVALASTVGRARVARLLLRLAEVRCSVLERCTVHMKLTNNLSHLSSPMQW